MNPWDATAVLDLHRALVAIPSVSHEEGVIADWVADYLRGFRVDVERVGDNVIARTGSGGSRPRLLLNSHLDTVPAHAAWRRDPWSPIVEDGRVYGLGSNDAKASVAAMIAAFVEAHAREVPCDLVLMLVPEEESGGRGTEVAWPHVRDAGWIPDGVVVGEPTGLDIAVAQKGLVVLELSAQGDGGHAANARALGARNAIRLLARDLAALDGIDLGPVHETLGPTTMEPTVIRGGEARNMVPAAATCMLDLRTVPGLTHDDVIARVRGAIASDVRVVSQRLLPAASGVDSALVRAATRARPDSRVFGSATMSDLVFFRDVPAIKCGPGRTERSHTPDEFVLEMEVLAGVEFYGALIRAFVEEASVAETNRTKGNG